ncbi:MULTISPECIES: MHYT domain-containing protein [Salipiger]|uniref:MHYT domain-containing protein n=1 Tax=Salipiger TaxID=263377 RepID=UPI0035178F19
MLGTLLQGILETQSNFIAAAAGVCVITAGMLVLLMRNSDYATLNQRCVVAVWVALVAGVGVWTTHFVAMIGYRPDAALTYDMSLTAISILVGVVLVGLPVAASLFVKSEHKRVGLGVVAGLGVAAMHLTGMSALENCLAIYNPMTLLIGIAAGIAGFVLAMLQEGDDMRSQLRKGLGMVAGVCALHFIAMGSVSIDLLEGIAYGIGGKFMSTLVASVSLGVFAVTVIGTMGYRRSLAMRRAGYWGESEFDRL